MVDNLGGDPHKEPKVVLKRKEILEIISFVESLNYGFKLKHNTSFKLMKYLPFLYKDKEITKLLFCIEDNKKLDFKLEIWKNKSGTYVTRHGKMETGGVVSIMRENKISNIGIIENILLESTYLQSRLRENIIDDLIK